MTSRGDPQRYPTDLDALARALPDELRALVPPRAARAPTPALGASPTHNYRPNPRRSLHRAAHARLYSPERLAYLRDLVGAPPAPERTRT